MPLEIILREADFLRPQSGRSVGNDLACSNGFNDQICGKDLDQPALNAQLRDYRGNSDMILLGDYDIQEVTPPRHFEWL